MPENLQPPTRENVVAAYRGILGREPENDRVIERLMNAENLEALLRDVVASPELKMREKAHAFFYYNAAFDAIELVAKNAAPVLTPDPSYLTNYLGVRVDPKVCPALLEGREGEIEAPPIPANWHADLAEFAAVLRAVEFAKETFTMVELGCGWGCWLNNAGTVAKRRDLQVSLTGVEGDRGHLALAQEALTLNGFADTETRLIWGVATSMGGVALFPRQAIAGSNWGLEPVFGADEKTRAEALRAGTHDELPMIPFSDLIAGKNMTLDLLHIDIQGGEADLVRDSLALINEHVRYLCIGTHSRQIEGALFADLLAAGWRLEIERPAILELNSVPKVVTDGVQGWRNQELLPECGPRTYGTPR